MIDEGFIAKYGQLGKFLADIGLDHLAEVFVNNDITELSVIKGLTETDLGEMNLNLTIG